MTELLKKLMNTLGPSGNEQDVRNLIKKEIKGYVDEMSVDKMGNLIARKKGKGQKIILASHMDEIGLMVQRISTHGHIKVRQVGYMENITLAGQPVAIVKSINNKIISYGIITFKELHEDEQIDGHSKKRLKCAICKI